MARIRNLEEIDTIYADNLDRYIVSLIVGYRSRELGADASPAGAARWALELTRDEGARDTNWFVYDRATKTMHQLEQHEFDPEMDGF